MALDLFKPHVRIRFEENPPVFVQYGQFYYENGQPVDQAATPWLDGEVAKLSPATRVEAGLDAPSAVGVPPLGASPPDPMQTRGTFADKSPQRQALENATQEATNASNEAAASEPAPELSPLLDDQGRLRPENASGGQEPAPRHRRKFREAGTPNE